MERKDRLFIDFNSALSHLREDETLSPTALGALSGAGKRELTPFAETWAAVPAERRRRAARMLVDLAEDNFEKDFNVLFRYMLNDDDPGVRASAIDGLWEDEDSGLIRPLVGFLRSDPDAQVRAVAADALGRFVLLAEYDRLPQTQFVDLIHEALLATIRNPAEPVAVRAHALEALAYWSEDLMREVIAAAYAHEDTQMRASAISAMGRSADKYWREAASSELDSADVRMRFEAARAVGELEDRTAVPRLIELLEDSDREVQGAAIAALGQIGGKQAREALAAAARSKDEVVRSLAGEALQELEFTRSSDFLLMDLNTGDEKLVPEVDEDDLGGDLEEEEPGEDDLDDDLEEEEWDADDEFADEELEDEELDDESPEE
ncbi:MAG: HEAT repeat domain-containing protein [Chloroflexi bacterium]|nr:HEAT repeat domain-containing protein [Chloroflexota bacterium]